MRAEQDTKPLDDKQVESAKQIALKLLGNVDTSDEDKQLAREFLLSIGMDSADIGSTESEGRRVARAFGGLRAGTGIKNTGKALELGYMTPEQARAWLSDRGNVR
jgi:hypothetical protein